MIISKLLIQYNQIQRVKNGAIGRSLHRRCTSENQWRTELQAITKKGKKFARGYDIPEPRQLVSGIFRSFTEGAARDMRRPNKRN